MTVALNVSDLTVASIDGNGAYDVLMRATKAHLEQEFKLNRIKGGEYASVYLGSLTAVLEQSVQFLLNKDKAANEANLIEAQIRLADAQVALAEQQVLNAQAEYQVLLKGLPKIEAEIELIEAQVSMMGKQEANVAKEGALLDKQIPKIEADIVLTTHQGTKMLAESNLMEQQALNAVIEGTVLVAQECKLRAEFDVLMASQAKTSAENALLSQKTATERAQISATGVDENSIIGKQVKLYGAQADGFLRDAEQKTAKVMVDSWNVRRTTDEATQANTTNQLDDGAVGRAVAKLLGGINA